MIYPGMKNVTFRVKMKILAMKCPFLGKDFTLHITKKHLI